MLWAQGSLIPDPPDFARLQLVAQPYQSDRPYNPDTVIDKHGYIWMKC